MKKLDRRRDFGTISGDTEGRAYHQDGAYFDCNGNQWGVPAPAPEPDETDAARLAEEQRLKDEQEAAAKAQAEAEAAAKAAAETAVGAETAVAGGGKKKAAAPADDQVAKQIAS